MLLPAHVSREMGKGEKAGAPGRSPKTQALDLEQNGQHPKLSVSHLQIGDRKRTL